MQPWLWKLVDEFRNDDGLFLDALSKDGNLITDIQPAEGEVNNSGKRRRGRIRGVDLRRTASRRGFCPLGRRRSGSPREHEGGWPKGHSHRKRSGPPTHRSQELERTCGPPAECAHLAPSRRGRRYPFTDRRRQGSFARSAAGPARPGWTEPPAQLKLKPAGSRSHPVTGLAFC